ncbi:MAG TPA: hypothetical protein VFN30_07655 [Chitinophagaceae bacterium]|nr:hypothetical protein [Chitinophagaceae bacterium]
MNNFLPYEEQIAQKLAQMPLPDMRDVIWARIETMLDAGREVNDTENNPEQNTSKAIKKDLSSQSWKLSTVKAIIIIAVIITIVIIKRQRSSKPLPKPASSETHTPVKNEKNISDTAFNNHTVKPVRIILYPNAEDKKKKNDTATTTVISQDSASVPVVIDSPVLKPVSIPVIQKDTVRKKQRGVQGISDSDYRFKTEKKDSTNN